MKYDLEERTEKFAKEIISLCKIVPINIITRPILDQLIRAATSIGANYHEANGASSRKDFKNKIFICKKEAKETVYWLNLLIHTEPNLKTKCQLIRKEAQELIFIFSKIASNTH